MFKVGGPLWAQATAGDNAFARIIKSGKKIIRKVLQKDVGTTKGKELPKPTWSLSAKPVQLKERSVTQLIGGLFPKQQWNSRASELRRQAALRLISNTRKVPVFAFVGLSLGASLDNNSNSGDDVLYSGVRGLFQQYGAKSNHLVSDDQQFSLESLELGQLIGKGCNAAVYEARPSRTSTLGTERENVGSTQIFCKNDMVEQISAVAESPEFTPAMSVSHHEAGSEATHSGIPLTGTAEDNTESPAEPGSDSMVTSDTEDDISIIDEDESTGQSSDIDSDLNGWVFYRVSPVESSTGDPPYCWEDEEDIYILAAEEESLVPIPETLDWGGEWSIFRAPSDGAMIIEAETVVEGGSRENQEENTSSSYLSADSSKYEELMSTADDSTDDLEPAPNIGDVEYPLAVKMMFNYSVESKADHIMSAMIKEMVPAQSCPSKQAVDQKRKYLPPHPNIVMMHGVFVDETPRLPGDAEVYPSALPPRLYKDGFGRNSTLFLVMKKYTMTLREFLADNEVTMATRCHLFAQLLEGISHLANHGIAHRDLKSDNILIDLTDGKEHPLLAISDFGCCLADSTHGLKIPYTTGEVDKGGNGALMAPEIKCAEPGADVILDYTFADLWAAGALAYEIFGVDNPFYSLCDARTYSEEALLLLPADVPDTVQQLVQLMLKRHPNQRPTASIAATIMQLFLWAPADLQPLRTPPAGLSKAQCLWQYRKLCGWLEQFAMETVCQLVFHQDGPRLDSLLKHLLLSRVTRQDILATVSFV